MASWLDPSGSCCSAYTAAPPGVVFATYIAMSARRMSVSTSSPCCGLTAMPIEMATSCATPSISKGCCRAAMIFCATWPAPPSSAPGRISANSAERVLHGDGVDEQPTHVPIGSDHAHHHVADGLAPRLGGDVRDLVIGHRGPVLAHASVLARSLAAFKLVGRPSEDPLRRSVREDDRTGRVADHDAARHRVIDGG